MDKKLKIIFFIFLIIPFFGRGVTKKKLKLFKTIPENYKGSFFPSIPHSFAIDSKNNIYYPLNFKHKVLKVGSSGELLAIIGKKGGGPGDLYLPFLIKIYKNKLFILDNNAFSIFSTDGSFLRRFRYFSGILDFTIADNKIFANYSIGKKVIKVMDFNGRKLYSFGDLAKINNVDFNLYKGKDFATFEDLSATKIASSLKNIFLLFPQFGVLCKYDLKGKLLNKKKIVFNNEKFDKEIEKIRSVLREGKYKRERIYYGGKRKGVDIWMISSFNFCDDKIFISISSNFTDVNTINIFQLNSKTLNTEAEYILHSRKHDISDNFIVKYKDESFYFYVPITDINTNEIKIGVFKLKKGGHKLR